MQNPEDAKRTGAAPLRIRTVLLWGALLALAIPPAVFLVCALWEGLSPGVALAAMIDQYQVRRGNLLVCGILGWIPLLLLAVVSWPVSRFAGKAIARPLALGGVLGILMILVWVNFEFWPTFLPERVNPSWPHGLEFVIGPLFFAPVAMLFGMAIAGMAARAARRAK